MNERLRIKKMGEVLKNNEREGNEGMVEDEIDIEKVGKMENIKRIEENKDILNKKEDIG